MNYQRLLKRGMLVLAAAAIAVAAGCVPAADAEGKKVQAETATDPVPPEIGKVNRE